MEVNKEEIIRKAKYMIEGKHYTVNYIEGYIDALLDRDLINDDEFAKLNRLLSNRGD